MAKVRVLLVTNEVSRSGAPVLTLRMFRALRDDIELTTISNRGGPLEDSFRELGPLTVLHQGPLTRAARLASGDDAAAALGGLQGRVRSRLTFMPPRRSRPDVLYINSAATLPVVARMPWIRRLGLPTILHVHETGVLLDRFAALSDGALETLPDHYIAVSEHVATALSDEHGVSPDRITVIPPVIDDHWLHHAAVEPAAEKAQEPLLIGGAGTPAWTKGPELWLRTARLLLDRHGEERVRFEWLGAGEDMQAQQMRAMVGKLGLSGRVTLLPRDADASDVFRNWDVLLMSSWEESASLVTLEMMALGKLVVCIRGTGGTAELVGDAGMVVADFSAEALADAIDEVTSDAGRMAELGGAAMQRVAEHYRDIAQAPRVLEVIRSAARVGPA